MKRKFRMSKAHREMVLELFSSLFGMASLFVFCWVLLLILPR